MIPSFVSETTRTAPTPVVLQSPANVVWPLIVQPDFIKLSNRQRIYEIPRLAVVIAPVNSPIAAGQNMVRIRRIDPQRMKVAVNFLYSLAW